MLAPLWLLVVLFSLFPAACPLELRLDVDPWRWRRAQIQAVNAALNPQHALAAESPPLRFKDATSLLKRRRLHAAIRALSALATRHQHTRRARHLRARILSALGAFMASADDFESVGDASRAQFARACASHARRAWKAAGARDWASAARLLSELLAAAGSEATDLLALRALSHLHVGRAHHARVDALGVLYARHGPQAHGPAHEAAAIIFAAASTLARTQTIEETFRTSSLVLLRCLRTNPDAVRCGRALRHARWLDRWHEAAKKRVQDGAGAGAAAGAAAAAVSASVMEDALRMSEGLAQLLLASAPCSTGTHKNKTATATTTATTRRLVDRRCTWPPSRQRQDDAATALLLLYHAPQQMSTSAARLVCANVARLAHQDWERRGRRLWWRPAAGPREKAEMLWRDPCSAHGDADVIWHLARCVSALDDVKRGHVEEDPDDEDALLAARGPKLAAMQIRAGENFALDSHVALLLATAWGRLGTVASLQKQPSTSSGDEKKGASNNTTTASDEEESSSRFTAASASPPDAEMRRLLVSAQNEAEEAERVLAATEAVEAESWRQFAQDLAQAAKERLAAHDLAAAAATDHYFILGVPRNATQSEIRQAFRLNALRWHPDKCQSRVLADGSLEDCALAQAIFIRLAEAARILSDPRLRAAFDAGHDAGGGGGGSQQWSFTFNAEDLRDGGWRYTWRTDTRTGAKQRVHVHVNDTRAAYARASGDAQTWQHMQHCPRRHFCLLRTPARVPSHVATVDSAGHIAATTTTLNVPFVLTQRVDPEAVRQGGSGGGDEDGRHGLEPETLRLRVCVTKGEANSVSHQCLSCNTTMEWTANGPVANDDDVDDVDDDLAGNGTGKATATGRRGRVHVAGLAAATQFLNLELAACFLEGEAESATTTTADNDAACEGYSVLRCSEPNGVPMFATKDVHVSGTVNEGTLDGGGWRLVRRVGIQVPAFFPSAWDGADDGTDDSVKNVNAHMNTTAGKAANATARRAWRWHPARDDLKGTSQYLYRTSSSTGAGCVDPLAEEICSVTWRPEEAAQFLFSSGDGTLFAVVDRKDVVPDVVGPAVHATVAASHLRNIPLPLRWNFGTRAADPTILVEGDGEDDIVAAPRRGDTGMVDGDVEDEDDTGADSTLKTTCLYAEAGLGRSSIGDAAAEAQRPGSGSDRQVLRRGLRMLRNRRGANVWVRDASAMAAGVLGASQAAAAAAARNKNNNNA